jgi:hypothetical protein
MEGNLVQYAWKQRAYPAPTPSRRQFQWKASALRSLDHIQAKPVTGHPVTILVPALYNVMPAEGIALGWLNEIDALLAIRHKISAAAKLTGWDVFTFHTQHNLDSFFNSNIAAVRDTWLREGSLNSTSVFQTLKQFGKAYDYHRLHARMVENLVFQSSLMEWLTARAGDTPMRFHVVGTALMSALVWSGALSFESAVQTTADVGARWDNSLTGLVEDELSRNKTERSADNIGWLRFHRIRQLIEGKATLAIAMSRERLPSVEAPAQPFWFSATAQEEPVLIQTSQDARAAMESMNLLSWSPKAPKPIGNDTVHGWLVSALHPMAAACRWSVYNYLLATPASSLLFLRHIAELGRVAAGIQPEPQVFQNRLRLSRMKVSGS